MVFRPPEKVCVTIFILYIIYYINNYFVVNIIYIIFWGFCYSSFSKK